MLISWRLCLIRIFYSWRWWTNISWNYERCSCF